MKEKTNKTQISIRLTGGLLERVLKQADREKRSRNNMIEFLLEEALKTLEGYKN